MWLKISQSKDVSVFGSLCELFDTIFWQKLCKSESKISQLSNDINSVELILKILTCINQCTFPATLFKTDSISTSFVRASISKVAQHVTTIFLLELLADLLFSWLQSGRQFKKMLNKIVIKMVVLNHGEE